MPNNKKYYMDPLDGELTHKHNNNTKSGEACSICHQVAIIDPKSDDIDKLVEYLSGLAPRPFSPHQRDKIKEDLMLAINQFMNPKPSIPPEPTLIGSTYWDKNGKHWIKFTDRGKINHKWISMTGLTSEWKDIPHAK